MNKSNFSGHGETLWWNKCERNERITFPLAHWFLIFWHYLVAFYFLGCPLFCSSPVTAMSKQAMVGISTICQRSGALPGTELAENTDTVPRTSGMKISLVIMGANQISDAIYFLVEGVTEQERCNQSTARDHPCPPSACLARLTGEELLLEVWSVSWLLSQ